MLGDIVTDQFDYSTDERWTGKRWIDGRKIYQKTVACGALPNASGIKEVAHGILNVYRIIRTEGWAYRSIDNHSTMLPMVYAQTDAAQFMGCDATVTSARLFVGADRSLYLESYVTIYYTCTDR
jgi:hypothetical protein